MRRETGERSLSEEVGEVDVEDPAGRGHQEVVEVAVAHAQNIRHHTIGR